MDTGAIKQTTTNNNNNKSPVAVLWEAVRRSSAAGGRPLSLGAERGYEGKGFLGAAAGVRNGSVVGKGTEREQPCSLISGLVTTLEVSKWKKKER